MLKRIPVEQLRVGMYLHEMCGSWIDHPFWRSRFALASDDELRQVVASGIREVMIDTARGLDVESIAVEAAPPSAPVAVPAAVPAAPACVEFGVELARAARICRQGKEAVLSMFQEARMGKAIAAERAAGLVQQISESVTRNPGALVSLARLKTADEYTYMHSVAVCALMVALARQLGLDEAATREAGLAGLLHDLGKARISTDVLNKPGKLTDEEFAHVKRHPELGHRMLAEGRSAGTIALDVCLHHHEKVDGSGYPHGLAGDAISLQARMGAVCDVYDAITSNRPYKSGWDPAESVRRMAQWTKTQFDDAVFQAFVKSIGIYPVGSLVRTSASRLAVVVEQNERALLTPKIKAFYSIRSQVHVPPELVDLSRPGTREQIVAREDPAQWGFAHLDELWAGDAARR